MFDDDLGSLLTGNLDAVVVAGAAGKDAEDITTSDVMLVTLLVDASSSIASRGLEDAVREGQNLLLDALYDARERENILLALWTFSDDERVVHSYVPLVEAVRLDRRNYRGHGCTCLYDTWCDALLANVAYAEKLCESGTPCRSLVVVVTDGEDQGSRRRASACADISRRVLASEQFTLAFVGVGDDVDFRAVAKSMGVPDGNVAVQASATPAAIRKVFQMVSQSAIRASQGVVVPGVRGGFFGP